MVTPPAVDAAVPGSTTPPARYWGWPAATDLSLLGTQMLAFGMTWAAASLSGALAGLVLTAIVLPRVLCCWSGVRWPTVPVRSGSSSSATA